MKALLIALLFLTACGKVPDAPISPSAATAPDSQSQPQVVVVDDGGPQAPAPEPTFLVTLKFNYITGSMTVNPSHQVIFQYGECNVSREMTAAEVTQVEADYGALGTACSFTSSFSGSSHTLNCLNTDARNLPYVNVSFCDWTVPYGVN